MGNSCFTDTQIVRIVSPSDSKFHDLYVDIALGYISRSDHEHFITMLKDDLISCKSKIKNNKNISIEITTYNSDKFKGTFNHLNKMLQSNIFTVKNGLNYDNVIITTCCNNNTFLHACIKILIMYYYACNLVREDDEQVNDFKQSIDDLYIIMKNLISMGVSINDTDDLGNTALHYLALTNKTNFVDELCEKGASLMIRNKKDLLPYTIANMVIDNNIMNEHIKLKMNAEILPLMNVIDLKRPESAKKYEDLSSCVICMDNKRTHVIIPCLHLVYCESCSKDSKLGTRCPICRTVVMSIKSIYIS